MRAGWLAGSLEVETEMKGSKLAGVEGVHGLSGLQDSREGAQYHAEKKSQSASGVLTGMHRSGEPGRQTGLRGR